MNSKQLTYHQFKQIASTLGSKVNDPKEVANASGIADMDYDLLHEYLSKWHAEKKINDTVVTTQENSESSGEGVFQNLGKKSLMTLFRSTLESSNDGLIIIDNNGKLIDWNDKFTEIARIPKGALEEASQDVGLQYIFDQVKDPQKLIFDLAKLEEENSLKGDFGEVEFADGRTIERYTQPLIIDNETVGRVWCFKDITEEKEHKDRINILTSAIQSATQGILVLDNDSIVYINDYLSNIMDLEYFDIKNNTISSINNKKIDLLYTKISQQIEYNKKTKNSKSTVDEEYNCTDNLIEILDGNNKSRWFELSTFESEYNEKMYTLGIINDITTSKNLQDQLSYNAYHDLLTGLPNRNKLISILKSKIARDDKFAVYFMDLDNFKLINDSLGHHIGDMMLKSLGQKLIKAVGSKAVVGRLGGDEFVVIIDNVQTEEENKPHLKLIRDAISKPIKVRDYEFNITFTVGVAMSPRDARTPEDLLKNADVAMYQKKKQGKNGIAFYDSNIKTKNMRKVSIANKIYKAIENNELTLHYQPIYDLQTHNISSLEALLRWNNQDLGGSVPPDEFITITEEIGYIDVITYWVFENSLQQLKRWHDAGYDKLRLTLNLSGALLYNPTMIDTVNNIISSSNVKPEFITVELTENVFINDAVDVVKVLNKMSEIGLKIAIDDFGTGYSSYAYLQKLPIDVIKIDKMFTQSLFDNGSKENKAIILSIVELGKHAGYDIVAEGIETINQMYFLREHNCKYGQGYHFSRPIPSNYIDKLLYENSLLD